MVMLGLKVKAAFVAAQVVVGLSWFIVVSGDLRNGCFLSNGCFDPRMGLENEDIHEAFPDGVVEATIHGVVP